MTEIKVLDKGLVRLVDHMGSDDRIVQAARCSYGPGTKTKREDDKLIRYLIRHGHWSPFEQVQFTFHLRLPLFVRSQIFRHRTFKVNEQSARYSEMEPAFYIPAVEDIRGQHALNKQSGGSALAHDEATWARGVIDDMSYEAYRGYRDLLENGVARELARMVLPVNLYTEAYLTADLRNLLNFFNQRLHETAQLETRRYAEAMLELVTPIVPVTIAAWKENSLYRMSFDRTVAAWEQELKAGEDVS